MDKQYFYVVDVGASAIKVFVSFIDESGLISVVGSGTAPAAGIVKAQIVDMQALAHSIRQAVDCAFMATNIPTGSIYLGMGGVFLEFSRIKGSVAMTSPDKVTSDDAERACRAALVTGMIEDRCIIHNIPINYWVDETPYGSTLPAVSGCKLEVDLLAVTMEQTLCDKLTAALRDQGLHAAIIGANAVIGGQMLASESTANCLWIDMGADMTDVAIVKKGCLVTAATLPFGGNYITNDIAQGLSVSWSHAEEIKRYYGKLSKSLFGQEITLNCNDYGTEDKYVAYDFLHMIVESRVDELISLTRGYIEDFQDTSELNNIVVTGGCAALPSIGETLEKELRLPVKTYAFDTLSAEYAYPANFTCYCLARYFAPLSVPGAAVRDGFFQALWRKVKKYI